MFQCHPLSYLRWMKLNKASPIGIETVENIVFEVIVSWPLKNISYIWSMAFVNWKIRVKITLNGWKMVIFVYYLMRLIATWGASCRHDSASPKTDAWPSLGSIPLAPMFIAVVTAMGRRARQSIKDSIILSNVLHLYWKLHFAFFRRKSKQVK